MQSGQRGEGYSLGRGDEGYSLGRGVEGCSLGRGDEGCSLGRGVKGIVWAEGMKGAVWAVFYHSLSTDDNPQHQLPHWRKIMVQVSTCNSSKKVISYFKLFHVVIGYYPLNNPIECKTSPVTTEENRFTVS